MTDYVYGGILVADAVTFRRATNAACTVYDVNDIAGTTPLALKDPSGVPLPNPITSSGDAFLPPLVTTSEGIKIVGGGLTVVVYSHAGMQAAAAASEASAQAAADSAATAAGNTIASATVNGAGELVIQKASGASVNAGSVKGPKGDKGDTGAPGKDGSNVLPTDDAIAQALNDPNSKARAAGNATYVPRWKPATAYTAGDKVLSPNGDVVSSKATHTSGASFTAANWNLSASYAKPDVQLSRPNKSTVTQGLYARVVTHGRALAADPSVTGRVWGVTSGGISFWDASGGARTDVTALPSTQSPVQMVFTSQFVFLVTSGNADRLGQVWRSPLPASNGTGLVWSKLFDLTGGTTTPTGAVDGGVGSYFREQSFATNGTEGYILEYGGTITGGPSLYYSANINVADPATILWTKRNTWANAKHGHGVAVVGGVPWAMFGDAGFTDLGLWRATAANAGTWNKLSLYGEAEGGNTLYGINIIPVTLDGQPVVLTDNDTKTGASVLGYNTQSNIRLPFVPLLRVPMPYHGTVRSLSLTSEGNLMWVQTGESGAVGALDSIWISKAPYTEPVLLESFPSNNTLSTLGAKVESGNYIFFGTYRITKEKFIGQ